MQPSEEPLTQASLVEYCRRGDLERIAAAFTSGVRPEKLSGIAPKLFKELDEVGGDEKRKAYVLAILHCASDSELGKMRFWPGYFRESVINSETLKSVSRERLELFADMLLNTSPQMFYRIVNELCTAGLLERPRTNGYTAGIISGAAWGEHHRVGLSESLAADPIFKNGDVWLLFEFDGTGEACLAGADKYGGFRGVSWESVLVKLSNEGVLDRFKLLDESLNALSRDFIQFRAGWFSRFHEALNPTIAERRERLDKYVRLLNSSIPPTVSFSMNAIMLIDKNSPIEFQKLSSSIGSALFSKSKQTVVSALKLLQQCAEREVDQRRAICRQACSALVNPNTEVQGKVLKLLDKYADGGDAELKETFSSYTSSLAASLRNNVPMVLLSTTEESKLANSSLESSNVEQPKAEVRRGRIVAPIADLSELVLKAAFVLENHEAYIEYELVVDAILKGCMRNQSDFEIQTSALLKRAKSRLNSDSQKLIKSFCYLLVGWITGEWQDEFFLNESYDPSSVELLFRELHHRRMREIIERVKTREPSCLLSLPTDEFGWIDSNELRRRLGSKYAKFDPLDKSFAILRVKEPDDALLRSIIGHEKHALTDYALECTNKKIEYELDRQESWGMFFMDYKMTPEPRTIFPEGFIPEIKSDKDYVWRISNATALELLVEGSLTPNIREIYFAGGVVWIGHTMSYVEVSDRIGRHYLHFLRDPSIVPGEYGSLLLVLAASSVCKDISIAGVDAFIELITEDRLNYRYTEKAMCNLLTFGDCIKANRWKQNFDSIARVSTKHSKIVYQLLERAVASLRGVPRDLHYVLELLVELKAEHGPLQSDTVENLGRLSAGGKTKKLISELVR